MEPRRQEPEEERPQMEVLGPGASEERAERRLVRGRTRVMPATTLIGDRVVSPLGEDLGRIKDIMVNVAQGRIVYAVLSFGGMLGVGDKLFAVPWQALRLDPELHHFVLDVPKEKLDNAPGFDRDAWPDMADADFARGIYRYYGYEVDWEI
jgi:sporulation protein YlmC with PRC-barrel domain